jgi:hypothetical protein
MNFRQTRQVETTRFALLAQVAPDERSRTRLLASNPARLYGFSPPVCKNPSQVLPDPARK